MAKAAKKTARKTKVRDEPIRRFRGINRSASRAVHELESALALSRRVLTEHVKQKRHASPMMVLYAKLTPRNRRKLYEHGELLLGAIKK